MVFGAEAVVVAGITGAGGGGGGTATGDACSAMGRKAGGCWTAALDGAFVPKEATGAAGLWAASTATEDMRFFCFNLSSPSRSNGASTVE